MTELLPAFLVNALLAGGLLSLLTGPLGCLLVWRRMAFFGDALAHAALLGVALSLFLQLPLLLCVLAFGITFAVLLALLQQTELANDTLLGILSPGALATGLIALSLLPGIRVDLMGYLFGDILALSSHDVTLLGMGVAAGLLLLAGLWKKLLAVTAARDLALVAGYPVRKIELALLVLLALVVAAGVQLVGVLLITALLIIPAATARSFARTPEHMAVGAALVGLLASTSGLLASLHWDIPAGPAIVAAAVVLFTGTRILVKP